MSTGEQNFSSEKQVKVSRWPFAQFLVIGMLFGLPGSLPVIWNLHLSGDFSKIGLHFLALNAGYICGAMTTRGATAKARPRVLQIAGSLCSLAALTAFALTPEPGPVTWLVAGFLLLGIGIGCLTGGTIHNLKHLFVNLPSASFQRAFLLFGIGCALSAGLAETAYSAGHASFAPLLIAPPVVFTMFLRLGSSPDPDPSGTEPERVAPAWLRRNVVAILRLLVFVQAGAEWASAAWLPIFLLRHIGTTPAAALGALALYFLFLVTGRALMQELSRLLGRRQLILVSASLLLAGFATLAGTQTLTGAFTATVLLGVGFGPVYPLIAETADARLAFEPVFYNSLLTMAVTGALTTACVLGAVTEYFGIRSFVILPAVESVAGCLLLLLFALESHVMGRVEA